MSLNKIPNLRHLRVFLEVVNSKSISRASESVFLSQPAITQAIAKLEVSLGTVLFERRSDGMYVSVTGSLLAGRVHRALEELMDGLRAAVRCGGGGAGFRAKQFLPLVTSTQLRALVAVAEAQNFVVASRNLGVAQSSLHRAARELESQLGVVLFEKTSVGTSATKAARILARSTKLAFSEIEQGWDEVAAHHHREVGRVLIGSMPLARTSVLPMAILEFIKTYPDFSIRVNDGPYDDLLLHLSNGDLDLLIGALRFPLPCDDVTQDELFNSWIEIVARPGHPLRGEVLTPAMLSKQSWVLPRQGTPTRRLFESLFEDAHIDPPTRIIETSSQILIRSLLRGSDHLTFISRHQIQYELDRGTLETLPYDGEGLSRPIGITTRKRWKPTATQLAFVNLLRQYANSESACGRGKI